MESLEHVEAKIDEIFIYRELKASNNLNNRKRQKK